MLGLLGTVYWVGKQVSGQMQGKALPEVGFL